MTGHRQHLAKGLRFRVVFRSYHGYLYSQSVCRERGLDSRSDRRRRFSIG